MTRTQHIRRMAWTYSTGSFARIVHAGGNRGFMNLGYAPDPARTANSAQRQRNLVSLLTDIIAAERAQLLLDVGCGNGGMAELIAASAPDTTVVGVNIDPSQLGRAPTTSGPRTSFINAAAEDLPFRCATFDTVYSVELLSHVRDKLRLAAGFARVLRSGGRVVLAYIALTKPFTEFDAAEQAHMRRVAAFFCEDPGDIPTLAAAEHAFTDAGLRLLRHIDLSDGVFVPRFADFVSMLRTLAHPNPLVRAAAAMAARYRWNVRPAEFIRFLQANTGVHPSRFYEYHVMEFIKNC